MYTLADYFTEAGLLDVPEASKAVELWHWKENKPLKPFWAQVTGLSLVLSQPNERSGIYDKVGAGKSLISYGYAALNAMIQNKVIICMKPALLTQYLEEFTKTCRNLPFGIEIYDGTPKQRDAQVDKWRKVYQPPVVLMTYDIFRKEWMLFKALGFNVWIGDECRMFQGEDSIIYDCWTKFMGPEGEAAAMLMVGTPASSGVENLFGFINAITPRAYQGRMHFDNLHIDHKEIKVKFKKNGVDRERKVPIVDGYRNLTLMTENLYKQARRYEPPRGDRPLPNIQEKAFTLSAAHKRVYDQLVDERLLIFDDNTVLDASTSGAIRHACKQAVMQPDLLGLEGESALFDMLDELLEQIDLKDTKVFIAAHYRKNVEMIAKRYERYNPAVIYGGTTDFDKEKQKFLNDHTCRMCVVNYISGGAGLNFQYVCHNTICAEPTTVPGDFEQVVGRTDREGQTELCNVFILVARGTVYVKDVATMQKREGEISSVVTAGALREELKGYVSGKSD